MYNPNPKASSPTGGYLHSGHGNANSPPVVMQPMGSNLPHYQQPTNSPSPHLPTSHQSTTGQPGAYGWMPLPEGYNNLSCPPGLGYLTSVDRLLVNQHVELLEVLTGFETANKYSVLNVVGQNVFHATEISDCCSRNLCGPIRPFDMTITDNNGQEVIHIKRPLACGSFCFPCCLQTMEVTASPGTVLGLIEQVWSIFPTFNIKNALGETDLTIKGPFCPISCCGNVDFEVRSKDGSIQVGKISKQWSGLIQETFTDADNFAISFPLDLDVKIKAVLLGACFLIDFMYFESSNERSGHK